MTSFIINYTIRYNVCNYKLECGSYVNVMLLTPGGGGGGGGGGHKIKIIY
jgi:hypothetical protein